MSSMTASTPTGTLRHAGAVAAGTTWPLDHGPRVSVVSGRLIRTMAPGTLSLTATAIEPGESLTGVVEVEDLHPFGSLLTLAETSRATTFRPGDLTLEVRQDGTLLYRGDFSGLTSAAIELGPLAPGHAMTLTFTVSVAPGTLHGHGAAGATYSLIATAF